ncbi:hypothetical protein GCM10022214_05650 [Actinomadura miaoliensis]|uniref:Uncharacterized protein n=1 Tax=Actinomadura miaoliensis TaxID=430685 RepID=A0ABP7V0C7_9ACTN
MTVTRDKDYDALTLTVVADFDAPIERAWRLWSDPRQRWWGGPPGPDAAGGPQPGAGRDRRLRGRPGRRRHLRPLTCASPVTLHDRRGRANERTPPRNLGRQEAAHNKRVAMAAQTGRGRPGWDDRHGADGRGGQQPGDLAAVGVAEHAAPPGVLVGVAQPADLVRTRGGCKDTDMVVRGPLSGQRAT